MSRWKTWRIPLAHPGTVSATLENTLLTGAARGSPQRAVYSANAMAGFILANTPVAAS